MTPPTNLFLGIDAGTSKVAAAIADPTRRVHAAGTQPHGAERSVPPGRAEQEPEAILQTIRSCVHTLPANLRRQVRGVGVTGQMHGVVVLDAAGAPRTPLITWQDRRSLEDPGWLDDLRARTGYLLHSGFGCATLAWLVRHQALPPGAAAACTIHDLLVARLCGRAKPVTDPTDAASWGLFDLAPCRWNMDAARAAGIPQALLPEILPTGSQAGTLAPGQANELGLPKGIPVAVALGDNQASLLATLREPGRELAVTLGTAGQVSAALAPAAGPEPLPAGATFEYRPYLGGRVMLVAATLSGGSAWVWLVESVRRWLSALGIAAVSDADLYRKLDELGLAATAEYTIRPTFTGERHAPSLRGAIEGLDESGLDLGRLARGLARGIFVNLRGLLPPEALAGRTRLVGSGNALRRSRLLQTMASEVFGLPLALPEGREEAAGGAALVAAMAAGTFQPP